MRPIDADALLKVLGLGANCEECEESVRGVYCAANPDLMDVCDAIADAPTIEPKKGEWETKFTPTESNPFGDYPVLIIRCSVCKTKITLWTHEDENIKEKWHYCPNCGARMERREDGTD